jgi:hypothetical protein
VNAGNARYVLRKRPAGDLLPRRRGDRYIAMNALRDTGVPSWAC